jgi:hypothetical protein
MVDIQSSAYIRVRLSIAQAAQRKLFFVDRGRWSCYGGSPHSYISLTLASCVRAKLLVDRWTEICWGPFPPRGAVIAPVPRMLKLLRDRGDVCMKWFMRDGLDVPAYVQCRD